MTERMWVEALALLALAAGAYLAHRRRIRSVCREREAALREAYARLEAANREARAELASRRELEAQVLRFQKMESLSRLAGGVAHEFNNLLTAINGYSEMLLRRLDPDDPRRKAAHQIRKAGERAAVLVRQLLTFSRRTSSRPELLDLNAVLRDMERQVGRLAGERIETVLALEPALGAIRADRGRIEEAILCVSGNARDAMPAGGRLLFRTSTVDLDAAQVEGHPEARPGRHVLLEISDT